jgi:hypothetical protein
MAELTPIEKLKIIEDDFQKWFRKAYELKDYTDVDVDFLVRDLPGAKSSSSFQTYRYYETQFKSTIKVPPQYQDCRQRFIGALGKYFVDSSKFLYQDQIRYTYEGFQNSAPGDWCRIDVYKSCGDEVGAFCVYFKLEGNLVITQVGYQIFGQMMSLCSEPENLRSFSAESLNMSGRGKMFQYYPKVFFDWLFNMITGLAGIIWIVLSYLLSQGLREDAKQYWPFFLALIFSSAVVAIPAFLSWIFLICFFDSVRITIFSNPDERLAHQVTVIEQDLSPIHFPVKYFNHDDFNEAFTKSHDHQIFFKQLQEVVNRMSALGESSNN